MVAYNEQKLKTAKAADPGFGRAENGIPRPEVNVTQSNAGSTGTLAIVITVIVLIVGTYFLYTNNWSGTTAVPSVTQNNVTDPAPAATALPANPPASVAITPDPAAEKTTPVKPDAKPAQ